MCRRLLYDSGNKQLYYFGRSAPEIVVSVSNKALTSIEQCFGGVIMTEETKLMKSPFSQEITYTRSNDLLADSRNIIETARKVAYKAVDIALVQRN